MEEFLPPPTQPPWQTTNVTYKKFHFKQNNLKDDHKPAYH